MPPTRQIVPLLAGAPMGWSISRARAAIDAHATGDFSESAQLARDSRRFHRIAGALNTRTGALKSRAGLPFQVEKSDRGDQRRAQTVADRTKDLWWDVCPETTIAQLHEDAVQLEAAIGFLEWQAVKVGTRTEWVPTLQHLPAEGLSYREWEGAWYYQTRDALERVTPGDGTWFLHLPGPVTPPFGGAILPIAALYVMSTWDERDWSRWDEKHGLAMLGIEEPAFAADDVDGSLGTKAFYDQFKRIGSEPIVREPQGTDGTGWHARWIESNGVGWQSFRGHLAYLGDASEYSITGMTPRGDQPLGGDGESVRERVRVEYLAADAEPFTTSLRDQVWKPYGRYNIEGWEDDLAAWGRWDTRPPTDLVVRASILTQAALFIPQLEALGADREALLDEFRIPRPKGKLPPPVKPAPATPPAGQPQKETP